MSKRGKALDGKDQGIYEKIMADGSKRYLVRIKYQQSRGKSGSKVETVNTLREARQLRKLGVSKRMVGGLSDKVTPRARLTDVVELFLHPRIPKVAPPWHPNKKPQNLSRATLCKRLINIDLRWYARRDSNPRPTA